MGYYYITISSSIGSVYLKRGCVNRRRRHLYHCCCCVVVVLFTKIEDCCTSKTIL